MKGPTSLVLAGIVLAASAAAVLSGQSQRGDYTQVNLGRVSQPAPGSQREGAVYSVEAYPLYRPQLAPGEGRELVEGYCNTCHSTIYITMQPPLPSATWEAEVNKMVRTFGQPIPEDAIPKIIAYLQKHYTPEARKPEKPAPRSPGAGKARENGKRSRKLPKPTSDHL